MPWQSAKSFMVSNSINFKKNFISEKPQKQLYSYLKQVNSSQTKVVSTINQIFLKRIIRPLFSIIFIAFVISSGSNFFQLAPLKFSLIFKLFNF